MHHHLRHLQRTSQACPTSWSKAQLGLVASPLLSSRGAYIAASMLSRVWTYVSRFVFLEVYKHTRSMFAVSAARQLQRFGRRHIYLVSCALSYMRTIQTILCWATGNLIQYRHLITKCVSSWQRRIYFLRDGNLGVSLKFRWRLL